MSDEGRRVFPMETALGVVAGKGGDDVLDFMGYAFGRSVCEDCRAGVNPVAKGWLYSLNPEFAKIGFNESVGWEGWVNEQKRKLGDNISITPMSAKDQEGVNALFDIVERAVRTAEDKTAAAEAAEAARAAAEKDAAVMAPFKKKAADLEAKLAQLEEKNAAFTAEIGELKAKLASFDGKVAVDENDLEKSVKDIVSKAVKAAVGGLVAAGGVVAADGGVAEPAAFEEEKPADGGVPDTFGFGASGSDGDGFGF